MKVRIITNRLNRFKYGQIVEEDSPRIKCLLENGEAEILRDAEEVLEVAPEPVVADIAFVPEENVEVEFVQEKVQEVPVKKKAGRPKKVK
jgi:hypothetical protein